MKKRNLITFMLLLVMLPCAMLFNGCSGKGQLDTKATLNTGKESNYVALTDNNDFINYLNADTTTATLHSYKLTLEGKEVEDGKTQKIRMNAICQFSDDLTTVNFAVKGSMYGSPVAMYITDGYLYMNMKSEGVSMKIKMLLASLEDMASYTDEFDIDNYVDMALDLFSKADSQVAVSFYEDNYTKYYKLSETVSAEVINDYYFVFENDVLAGIKFNMTEGNANMTFTLAKFEGTIDFPDFSDYVDYSSMLEGV